MYAQSMQYEPSRSGTSSSLCILIAVAVVYNVVYLVTCELVQRHSQQCVLLGSFFQLVSV
jgi:hypothetical protein